MNKIQKQEGTIVLGTVGSVDTELKGQDTIIKALAKLKAEGFTNYIFQMVGTGKPNRLRNLAAELGIANQIEFLGEFKHDDVQNGSKLLIFMYIPVVQKVSLVPS